jgi:hypothetical protein
MDDVVELFFVEAWHLTSQCPLLAPISKERLNLLFNFSHDALELVATTMKLETLTP